MRDRFMAFRGTDDCIQDCFENAPFASIGGLKARSNPQRPQRISEDDWPDYWRGYSTAAAKLYGSDWETCEFSWRKALTLGDAGTQESNKCP